MTPKQQRFVAEYLVDLNASAAARRAGYRGDANTVGPRMLANVGIQAAIASGRQKTAEKLEISAERVLAEVWGIVVADARELVEYRVGCCRHCHGAGHRHQRTAGEMERDRALHVDLKAGNRQSGLLFDEQGGSGFDPRRDPHSDCPECFGEGVGRTVVNDTRKLSPTAAALYAGVKQTKDGVEVRMHDKLAAAEKLFRHLGLFDRMALGADVQTNLGDPAATFVDQGRALLAAAAAGQIPVGQAAQILAGLGNLARLVTTDQLAARIAALEEKNGIEP